MSKFHAWRGKYFPERQLFLRSEGRVRFVTIGSYTQLVATTILAGTLVWGSITSYAYLTRDKTLERKNRTIASMSAQYQALSTDFSTVIQKVERQTKQLEERQKFLEEVAGASQKADGQQTAPTTDTNAPQGKEDDQAADSDGETSSADEPSQSRLTLLERLLGTGTAQASVPEKSDVDWRKSLSNRLRSLGERQQDLATRLLAKTDNQLSHIDTVLKGTKITTGDLIRQYNHEDDSAIGGPFMPESGFKPVFDHKDGTKFSELLDARHRLEMVTNVLNSFPVGKPADKYYVASRFGRRMDPFRKTWAHHYGLDLAGWPGTAIHATAPGVVIYAGWHGPYGKMVEIDHGNGFHTRYGHMRKLRVHKGEVVQLGQQIGDMGKTGRATDTHVHYEVWFDGKVRDPMPYLKAANDVRKIQGRYEETSQQ
ncbi:peptidoglycan DD-metalloendopeptidase family protein [Kordiimonas marina]|uniref:peptidoglycan DD-metalloendopeptidase family protein n=1 Tax=Kordiimonas marina TaxID=2872312 RepID=UPI001FF6EEE2|nr:peptidoglycan DD-metalloendopeptidase family protein [Kordiimonas marina]